MNMWYTKIINSKIDGLVPLLSLFENKDEFIKHFFSNVEFFRPREVAKQSEELLKRKNAGERITVRYSMKCKANFHYDNSDTQKGISKKSFKNKKEAGAFSDENNLIHNDTNISVSIDKDGNYSVRKEIFDAIGYKVSQGALSDIKNYVISHIWAKTDNPLFFTSLWNITLIPNYLSFILDKPDDNSEIVREIKNISKAICFLLYNPSERMQSKIIEDAEFVDCISIAQSYIDAGIIHFIDPHTPISNYIDVTDIIDSLDQCEKNKEFVLTLLENLKKSKIDFIGLFTDRKECQIMCKMSYPILVDVTNNSESEILKKKRPVNSDVYYSPKTFHMEDKDYLICNDWKAINKELIMQWLSGTNE